MKPSTPVFYMLQFLRWLELAKSIARARWRHFQSAAAIAKDMLTIWRELTRIAIYDR